MNAERLKNYIEDKHNWNPLKIDPRVSTPRHMYTVNGSGDAYNGFNTLAIVDVDAQTVRLCADTHNWSGYDFQRSNPYALVFEVPVGEAEEAIDHILTVSKNLTCMVRKELLKKGES